MVILMEGKIRGKGMVEKVVVYMLE